MPHPPPLLPAHSSEKIQGSNSDSSKQSSGLMSRQKPGSPIDITFRREDLGDDKGVKDVRFVFRDFH